MKRLSTATGTSAPVSFPLWAKRRSASSRKSARTWSGLSNPRRTRLLPGAMTNARIRGSGSGSASPGANASTGGGSSGVGAAVGGGVPVGGGTDVVVVLTETVVVATPPTVVADPLPVAGPVVVV